MTSKKKQRRKARADDEPRSAWRIHFFKRHSADHRSERVPARDFLDQCPTSVAAKIVAVVHAIAAAPPPAFSGGGKWEAMHGDMAGFYEIRVEGPRRHHYRLFCILERDGAKLGLGGPSLVLITGKEKPFRTTLSAADYEEVRRLGQEYRARTPRSVER